MNLLQSRIRRRLKGTAHADHRRSRFEVLEDRLVLSVGDVLAAVADQVELQTFDQSMWGPGNAGIIDEQAFFGVTWDETASETLGDLNSTGIRFDSATAGTIGVDLALALDPGSVDAEFGGLASLEVVRGDGDLFTIHSELSDGPTGSLMTRSPNIDLESNFIFDLAASLAVSGRVGTSDTTITVPTVTWVKSCRNTIFGKVCIPVPKFGSEQVIIPGIELAAFDKSLLDFSIDTTTNLLKLTNDPANPEFSILGKDLVEAKPGGNLAATFEISFDPFAASKIDVDVKDPNNPKPKKDHATELFDVKAALSVGDVTIEAATLFLDDATFENGALNASGAADLARFDIDLDFLASALFGLPPLGATFGLSAAGFEIFNVGVDLLDVDIGPLFSIGQDFTFVPELWVDLTFAEQVSIDGQPTDQYSMPVGTSVDVSYAGASTGATLDVETSYSVRNQFTNSTNLLVAPFLDALVLGAKIETLLGTIFDAALFDFEPLVGPAVKLATIFEDTFSLGGFGTVPGQTLNLVFNLPPDAVDDTASTVEDQAIAVNVLANDSDPNGDPLTIVSTTAAANGTVQIDDNDTADDPSDDQIVYTPNPGFAGTDRFTYTIDDGSGLTDSATVEVTVLNLVDLAGLVFNDLDNDGLFEPANGELGIGGVTVQLFNQTDDTLIATQLTAPDGTYSFDVNLGAGTYQLVQTQPAGFLDGDETVGSTDGGITTNGTANAALPADGDEITDIVVGDPGTTGDGAGYRFAEILPSWIQGLAWEDFDNDGEVDFGEFAIGGVSIALTGTDDRGNPVSRSQITDEQGIFEFVALRPGTYAVTAAQPTGFIDGKDVVGEVGGVLTGDNDGASPALSTNNDQFTGVILPAPGSAGVNYNFGERLDGGTLSSGQTAGIGFWQNKNGQALIASLNGSPDSTLLAQYLSDTFPNMYGGMADANGDGTADDPMTNVEVAALYKDLFKRNGSNSPAGPPKLNAKVLALAMATYVTKQSLAQLQFDAASSTGFVFIDTDGDGVYDLGEEQLYDTLDDVAEAQGFSINAGGVGSTCVNVGNSGDAFDVADNTDVRIIDLLLATDRMSSDGLLYDVDKDGIIDPDEELLRVLADNLYSAINEV